MLKYYISNICMTLVLITNIWGKNEKTNSYTLHNEKNIWWNKFILTYGCNMWNTEQNAVERVNSSTKHNSFNQYSTNNFFLISLSFSCFFLPLFLCFFLFLSLFFLLACFWAVPVKYNFTVCVKQNMPPIITWKVSKHRLFQ